MNKGSVAAIIGGVIGLGYVMYKTSQGESPAEAFGVLEPLGDALGETILNNAEEAGGLVVSLIE